MSFLSFSKIITSSVGELSRFAESSLKLQPGSFIIIIAIFTVGLTIISKWFWLGVIILIFYTILEVRVRMEKWREKEKNKNIIEIKAKEE